MGDNPGLKSLNNRLVSYIDKVDMYINSISGYSLFFIYFLLEDN